MHFVHERKTKSEKIERKKVGAFWKVYYSRISVVKVAESSKHTILFASCKALFVANNMNLVLVPVVV